MSSRQKSCIACAGAKRRCHPQLPRCPRCIRRGIKCAYKNEPLQAPEVRASGQSGMERPAQQEGRALEPPMHNAMLDSSPFTQLEEFDTPLALRCETTLPVEPWIGDPGNHIWFTDDHLSELTHNTPAMVSIPAHISRSIVKTEPWAIRSMIQSFMSWPKQFVNNLETPFIHCSSQDSSILQPIEESFSGCAGYVARTEKNSHLVLNAIEHKVDQLIQQQPHFMALDMHLATLQAVLLLHLIQLWDGDVRQRALAEMHIENINIWAINLHYRTLEVAKFAAAPTWEQWVTIESARRTVVLAFVIHAVYEASKRGGCGYTSTLSELPVTTIDGPWVAKSPSDWEQHAADAVMGLSTYAEFTSGWKQADGGPGGNFAKLLLTPCVGAAYKSRLLL
ncbi:hypothetical protein BX600DRAFT_102364 [Xylariales sp. PMI_506]|nr:hypothetical protein BX600DRAFT_102364 [Xylariales sp. PMI_506]